MNKRSVFIPAIGALGLFLLYAFSFPQRAQQHFLTIFTPERAPVVALPVGRQPQRLEAPVQVVRDTFEPFVERYDSYLNGSPNKIDLNDPAAVQQTVTYDPISGNYIITEKIGDNDFRPPTYLTFDEYVRWRERQQRNAYFDRLQGVSTGSKKNNTGIGDPVSKFDVKTSLVDRIFGGDQVDIKPQGNINLTFGINHQRIKNPILTKRQQNVTQFDFDMQINMGAQGKIGEKLNLNFNYNTQATFDFDNQMKLNYDTKNFSEDEILQNIEAGNVSMPLRSQLIKGAQNLFGLKTEMKFGHLRLTTVAAQQRSRQNNLTVQGGAQVQRFEVPIDDYDENRHFFISHYNRNAFEPTLRCLPVPQTLFKINRMEVWITNDQLRTENTRDIVALADLAETRIAPRPNNGIPFVSLTPGADVDVNRMPLAHNGVNSMYADLAAALRSDTTVRHSDKVIARLQSIFPGIQQIRDFEKQRCRLLAPTEYSFHDQLGFLSINLNVQPDQIVGVAVEYMYNGKPYKIGEFTSDFQNGDTLNQNVLFVKMLKSTAPNVYLPMWDLMMKNVYGIGAANLDPQEFRFDIFYDDPGKGFKRFLNGPNFPPQVNSVPLLQLFGLDALNLQQDPAPDGVFDFVPGLTINLRSGRVMFPVLEPFGKFLNDTLRAVGVDTSIRKNLVFSQLYDSTLFRAREMQHLNRFVLRGQYKSSSNAEISLGTFNLPRGSVRVSGGGRQLIEGQDYEVDYNIGKVRILNDAILQSGQNVNVSFEDNALFGFQNRTMLGLRADYDFGKDLKIGATFMNLFERPLTQKVNFGEDPINNKMYGLDVSLSKETPWITKVIDKLPFYSTKAPSSIAVQAEGALLQPGHARAINQGDGRGGIVYIDDFEGSTNGIPLSNPANAWVLASTPSSDGKWVSRPEVDSINSVIYSANRAKLSWFIADPIARRGNDNNSPYARLIQFQDLFPNRQLTPLEQSNLRPLDVTYDPRQRGPYNFDLPKINGVAGYPGISAGLTEEGLLHQPATRWAGFMRGLNTNDFEAANIEFIEFWLLNPYMEKGDSTPISESGEMFIDLGSINEDLMRDGRQFFENALPTTQSVATVNTAWGRVPVQPPVVLAFDNEVQQRALQDVGFDGLDDAGERAFFADYIAKIEAGTLTTAARKKIIEDPSGDNFTYYLDRKFTESDGILRRYYDFNSPQGNSQSNEQAGTSFVSSATNLPDVEDLNRDNSLNESESFFRYRIPMPRLNDSIDINDPIVRQLVTDRREYISNGIKYIWYRFKIPLDNTNVRRTVGGIQDFRSIRFVRAFFQGFTERTTFRFATFMLGRNQWRRFTQPLGDPTLKGCDIGSVDPRVAFDVNTVGIEANSSRYPFAYTIPNGIQRERSVGAFPDVLQNEQALSMEICDMSYCDARAIFKTLNMDLRQFKRLKMFVHAEEVDPAYPLDSTDLTVFIRLGSDFYRNFYEYEIPLYPSRVENLAGYLPDSREYKDEVWRPENSFDIPLEIFTKIKSERNALGNWDLEAAYESTDPDKPGSRIKVVGNPNLGFVKGAMIGVRNRKEGKKQCVEVWVNEMRLNDFNERAGYAALARADIKLADLGNLALAGSYTSPGWRSIEQKLVQTNLEEIITYDISTSLELSKFLPEKWGLRLPFYWQYSQIRRTPEYDPYDLDLNLKEKLRNIADPTERQAVLESAQDITTNKGFNFTNVRKERKGGKSKSWPWSIENFSFTYAFNNQIKRNPFVVLDDLKQYKGGLDYQYRTNLKPIQPFKKLIKKDKYLKFITDFNFNPLPSTYGFSTNLERIFQTTTWRFVDDPADPSKNTYFNKRFMWDRDYDLAWEISKGIRLNYDALARSIIDEPMEVFNGQRITREVRNDSILKNLRNLGRPKSFNQNFSLNWTLPFKTIPFMDWVNVKASYTGGYTWTAASLKMQFLDNRPRVEAPLRNLGHVIQNKNTRQINGDLNFETLYNKSKYLAKINKGLPPNSKKNKKSANKPADNLSNPTSRDENDGGDGDGGDGSNRKDKKSDRRDKKTPKDDLISDGDDPVLRKKQNNAPDNKSSGNPATGKPDKNDNKTKDAKSKDREPSLAERIAIRPLLLLRKGRFTYSEQYSSVVPGFLPEPKLMGLSEGFNAPGWAYVFGQQPQDGFIEDLAARNLITHRAEFNQEYTRTFSRNFDAGLTVEPFKDFRVELTANQQFTKNKSELYKDQNFVHDLSEVQFERRAVRDAGSFSTSFFSMKTMFGHDINALFERYGQYRSIISNRLGTDTLAPHKVDGPNYKWGYGKIQQEVLIPAFLAAYTHRDPRQQELNIFKTRPAINWKLNYNGLSKVGNLNKIFNSVTLSHAYKNILTVNQYNTDIFYEDFSSRQFFIDQVDPLNFNYVARYEIPQVVINEQFAPLLGLDIKFKNDMTIKVDFKKSRNLAMSFVDYQLAETQSSGYTFGFGYRLKNVNIPFLTGVKKTKSGKLVSKKKKKKRDNIANIIKPDDNKKNAPQGNDMNFKFDFDLRDDITVNHRLDQADQAVPTRGSRTLTISPSVDYQINRRLKLRAFCDYRQTTPKTSASFPITNMNAGVTVQFLLN